MRRVPWTMAAALAGVMACVSAACCQSVTPEIRVTNLYQVVEEYGAGCGEIPGRRSVGIIQYLVYEISPANSAVTGTWDKWASLLNRNGYFYSIDLSDPNRVIRLRGIYCCADDVIIEDIRQGLLNEGWYMTGVFVRPDGERVQVTSTTVLPSEEVLPKKALVPVEKMSKTRDPINIATGEVLIQASDFSVSGPPPALALTRTYRSQSQFSGIFGYGWRSAFDLNLQERSDGAVVVYDGSGTGRYFTRQASGAYTASPGTTAVLVKTADNGFQITEKDGTVSAFAGGRLVSTTDRNGNRLLVRWDPQGSSYIEDCVGRRIVLELDSAGRLIKAVDPLGRQFSYSYDEAGNLAAISDPAHGLTRYSYDEAHNIVEMTNALGHKTYFGYDSFDRAVMNRQDDDVNKVTLEFAQNATVVTDALGGQSTYTFNDYGLQTSLTDPLGLISHSVWDPGMRLIESVDPAGHTSRFSYDAHGNLVTAVDPLNRTTVFAYTTDFNLPESVTDPAGAVTRYEYDQRGNLVRVIDPCGAVTLTTRDSRGLPLSVTDAHGGMTVFSYNTLSQPVSATDALGGVSRMSYDSLGNLLSVTDALSRQTIYSYDALNRPVRTVFPDGTNQTAGYDAFGNRVNVTDSLGRVTAYVYDAYERLNCTIDPAGGMVRVSYDNEGNVVSLTDQNNRTTLFAYDAAGRKITETDPLGRNQTYAYDAAGNLVSRTDRNANTTVYDYDAAGQLVRTRYADGSTVMCVYDAAGRRSAMSDRFGTTVYGYDRNGRVLQVDGPENADTITYSYDLLGRRTGMVDQNNRQFTYRYDALGRLLEVNAPAGATAYDYDAAGRVVSVTCPNTAQTTVSYDVMDRPLTVLNTAQSVPVSSFEYVYGADGRLQRKTSLGGLYREYSYDALGRLVAEKGYAVDTVKGRQKVPREVFSSEFGYDSAGNRINWTVRTTVGTYVNDMAPGGDAYIDSVLAEAGYQSKSDSSTPLVMTKAYSYDAANRLLHCRHDLTVSGAELQGESVSYWYDDNGNRVREERVRPARQPQVTVTAYDQENRLTALAYVNKPEAEVHAAAYEYNGDGLRVKAIEGESVTAYNYDGTEVLFEKDELGRVERQYTRAPGYPGGIGGIISERCDVEVVTGKGKNKVVSYVPKELYFMYDAAGNTVNLADAMGVVISSYEYDAYGGKMRELDPTGNMYQFSTKEWEAHAGLLYFGARYYDPAVGRWLTPDPLGMVDGTNVYAYCGGDPVNAVDPWGLCKETAWWPKWANMIVPGYRRYGGPMRSGPGTPEDLLDAVYQRHDIGYSEGDLDQADLNLIYSVIDLPENINDWGQGVNPLYAYLHSRGSLVIFSTRLIYSWFTDIRADIADIQSTYGDE